MSDLELAEIRADIVATKADLASAYIAGKGFFDCGVFKYCCGHK